MDLDRQIVLHLLNEDDCSPIIGKTRFQKLIFLINVEIKNKIKDSQISFDFIPFRYGPYSSKLNSIIYEMVEEGLIKRDIVSINDSEMLSFSITDKGKNSLIKNPEMQKIIKIIQQLKEHCKKMPLDQLIMKVYQRYPQYAVKSELINYKL
jgi:uncharacterized protein YwgA